MVVVRLIDHRHTRDAREIDLFIQSMCKRHALGENEIIGVACAISEMLTPQYCFLLGSGGDGYIPTRRRDKYVLGYVVGCVVKACSDIGYAAQSQELLLCWLLVAHKAFGVSLDDAASMLQRCKEALNSPAYEESFGAGLADGSTDGDISGRETSAHKLKAHLMEPREWLAPP